MSRLTKLFFLAFLYFLTIPLIIFYALALTGSTSSDSPGIANIFLVEFTASNKTDAQIPAVRVGYFGICLGRDGHWDCTRSSGRSSQQLMDQFFDTSNPLVVTTATDPAPTHEDPFLKTLLDFAMTLQSQVFLWLLAVSGTLLMLGLLGSLVEAFLIAKGKYGQSDPSSSIRSRVGRLSSATNWASTAIALAAAVGIVQATSALEYTSKTYSSDILIVKGTPTQALHWLIAIFSFVITLGLALAASPAASGNSDSSSFKKGRSRANGGSSGGNDGVVII